MIEDWEEVNKPWRKRKGKKVKIMKVEVKNDLNSTKVAEAGGGCEGASRVKLTRKERRRRRIEDLAGQKIPGDGGEGGWCSGAVHQDGQATGHWG